MSIAFDTKITRLFGTRLPIVQGAMAWLSEAPLAAAVSNAGALGVLGASLMSPEAFDDQVVAARSLTEEPFAVNFPLVLGDYRAHLDACLKRGVRIFFVSAGSPKVLTPRVHEAGGICVHVVPDLRRAQKVIAAGVDALVLESFEAGGHVSPEGITALTNINLVSRRTDLPLIAAGGIVDGRGLAAALALGADGVQMGTRFIGTQECNAHARYKELLVDAEEGDARVFSLRYHPSRALRAPMLERVLAMEEAGASSDEVRKFLGQGRAKKAAHDGDLEEGMFYAGAGAGLVDEVLSVQEVIHRIVEEYQEVLARLDGGVRTS